MMKMFSFRRKAPLLAVMLAFLAVSKSSAAPSTKLLTFMSLFSGKFTNYDEVEQDRTFNRPVHDSIVNFIFSIEVNALDSPYTFLLLEKGNDIVNRVHVLRVTEDPDGNIRLRPFNLTSAGMEKLRFDLSDPPRVINLEPEELVKLPIECDAVFVQIENNVFLGQWPDCRDSSPGEMQHYDASLTCNRISGYTSAGTLETPTPLPYIVTRQTSYPLLPQMLEGFDNFTVPCTCS